MFSPTSYLWVYLPYEASNIESTSSLEHPFLTRPHIFSIFGPRCPATSHASPPNVLHVAKLSLKLNLRAFICPFQFHIIHGKILVWTLCLVCLELEMERIPCLLLWTVSLKWHNGTFYTMQQDRRCFICCKSFL